jgi:hypothetical protein
LTGRSKEELEALLVIAKMEKRDKEEAMKDTVIANQALRSELKKYKEMVSSMSVANAEHVNSLVRQVYFNLFIDNSLISLTKKKKNSERNIISAQLQDLTKIKNERDTANAKLSGASAIIKLKQAELDAINAAMKSKPKPPAFGDSSFSIDTTKGFGFGNAAQNSPPAPGFGGFGTRKK